MSIQGDTLRDRRVFLCGLCLQENRRDRQTLFAMISLVKGDPVNAHTLLISTTQRAFMASEPDLISLTGRKWPSGPNNCFRRVSSFLIVFLYMQLLELKERNMACGGTIPSLACWFCSCVGKQEIM